MGRFERSDKPRVILRSCPEYDPAAIGRIVREGLDELGLAGRVRGRVTIKPNVVMAHPKVAPSGYTRPEFMEGILRALDSLPPVSRKAAIVEKCGAGVPTSRMFRRAGYYRLRRTHPLRVLPVKEARKKKIRLERGLVHETITTAPEIVDNDFLIYAPKLKTNYLAHGLTAALKLNIGILRDRQRMWNHNYLLDDKIVDLLEAGYPDFIATDAVEIAMGGNQFTQHGRHLGLIILANQPLAHDVICAHIFHLNPRRIGHLARAAERGYGSLDLAEIETSGDLGLDEVRERTKSWEVGFIRVDEVTSGIKVLSGEPYCTGGCQGVFLDWLYMIKDRKPRLWSKLPPWTVVIGKYTGDITADRVMIVGTCSAVEGRLDARRVRRIKGCPPKHKDLVLWMFLKARILNPLFRLDLIYDAYVCLFFSWIRRFFRGRL
jgi:uncharacterized protein (DUF362 family)